MALWPATKILMNANLGQLKSALKISSLTNSSTAGSVYENIYFSFLQHSDTSPASPAVAAICPLFSHSPTLQSFWTSVKNQAFHSHHPLWGFNSPVHQSCRWPSQLWIWEVWPQTGITPLGHTWGNQLHWKDYQIAVWIKAPYPSVRDQ